MLPTEFPHSNSGMGSTEYAKNKTARCPDQVTGGSLRLADSTQLLVRGAKTGGQIIFICSACFLYFVMLDTTIFVILRCLDIMLAMSPYRHRLPILRNHIKIVRGRPKRYAMKVVFEWAQPRRKGMQWTSYKNGV